MHGSLQFALAALLASVALAAPTTNGLVKRSFEAQTNGRELFNPLDEINLTHRKYGWQIIIINPESETTSTVQLEPPVPFSTSTIAGFTTAAVPTSLPTASPSGSPSASSSSTGPYGNGTKTSSSASPTGTGSGGSEDGTVSANPESNEKEYLSPVTVGGQKLNLNFDTGSADL